MAKSYHDSEKLARGQQVFTACAFIYKETSDGIKLFSAKRAQTKKFLPGVYELPGGHIDFGEDMKEGLTREIREEFGTSIKIGECFEVFTYTNEIKRSHSLEAIYFAQFSSDEADITLDPTDHESYIWVGENELKKIQNENKGSEDQEVKAIKKGFALLAGNKYDWHV